MALASVRGGRWLEADAAPCLPAGARGCCCLLASVPGIGAVRCQPRRTVALKHVLEKLQPASQPAGRSQLCSLSTTVAYPYQAEASYRYKNVPREGTVTVSGSPPSSTHTASLARRPTRSPEWNLSFSPGAPLSASGQVYKRIHHVSHDNYAGHHCVYSRRHTCLTSIMVCASFTLHTPSPQECQPPRLGMPECWRRESLRTSHAP